MLNITMRRKLQIAGTILVLSVLLAAMTALAVTQLVKAGPGGTIDIADGISLKIKPHSLTDDVEITAEMWLVEDEIGNRVEFSFLPDSIIFGEPAKLIVNMDVINAMGLEQLTLYGPGDEPIEPDLKGNRAIYEIPHFSIYYYRRR